jgi:hypothetical protein
MAARTHFRKPASRLTREEAARLAAILPAPRRWSPHGPVAARRAKKDCVLTIESHEVEGGTPRATGTTVTVIGPATHGSLIRLRRDFIPEILKTAEDL